MDDDILESLLQDLEERFADVLPPLTLAYGRCTATIVVHNLVSGLLHIYDQAPSALRVTLAQLEREARTGMPRATDGLGVALGVVPGDSDSTNSNTTS